MKKWYYTYYINHKSFVIYQTDDYNNEGGYETKQDAVTAAKLKLNEEIKYIVDDITEKSNIIYYKSIDLNKLLNERDKLEKI